MPKFTIEQKAAGILTTWLRGDMSLAVSRLAAVEPKRREAVRKKVRAGLSAREGTTFDLYCKRLGR